MTKLRQQMIDAMRQRGYSVRTHLLRCTPNGKADYTVRGTEATPVERM